MREASQAVAVPQRAGATDIRALLTMAVGVSILSLGPWLVRLAGVGGAASAFWRLSLAVPPLVLIARASGDRLTLLSRRSVSLIGAAGLVYGLGTVAMNASALRTTLANCALIGNFSSFFIAGTALVGSRRVPDGAVILCLLMSALGLALLIGPSVEFSSSGRTGDLLALLAAILFSAYFTVLPRVPAGPSALTIHLIATATGAIVAAPMAMGGKMIPAHWLPIAGLVFAQVVGQGLVVRSVPRLPGVVVGLCILLYPLESSIVGWSVYGEMMTTAQLAGAALILTALIVLQLRRGDVPRVLPNESSG